MLVIQNKLLKLSIWLSWSGFALFLIFYLVAAMNYPGGSFTNPGQNGFSFSENYLCDLLDNVALNGILNSAKVYARISLGFLALGILLFWFHLPAMFPGKKLRNQVMRISGMTAMLIMVFLAAGNHDIITRLAGLFGSIAMILAFVALYKAGSKGFVFFGIACLLLIIFNYYSYETGFLRKYLPLIQKISTVAGLLWFSLLNLKLYRFLKENKKNQSV
ncbi:MAG: hypothetical protein HKN54_01170 [Flavobacteriaceae bacterium]|nr:hypothetical protein [Flavobacteriaceae bacterium]